jgi:hypothetical protein
VRSKQGQNNYEQKEVENQDEPRFVVKSECRKISKFLSKYSIAQASLAQIMKFPIEQLSLRILEVEEKIDLNESNNNIQLINPPTSRLLTPTRSVKVTQDYQPIQNTSNSKQKN